MKANLLTDVQGLERIQERVLRHAVERMQEQARQARAERLATKWGARLVVSGQVMREGGAR
jgi:hypothetical protein